MPPRRPRRLSRSFQGLLLALFLGVIYLFFGGKKSGSSSGTTQSQSHNPVINSVSNLPWNKYAYIQYASGLDNLCHSLIIFDSLAKSGSLIGRVLVYPQSLEDGRHGDEEDVKRLLDLAQKKYRAALRPVEGIRRPDGHASWGEAYNRFQAWNQTDYERLLYLDSDALLLNSMDELFLLPPTPLAFPRAYWFNQKTTISTLEDPHPMLGPPSTKFLQKTAYTTIGTPSVMLITPSQHTFDYLIHEMESLDAADADSGVEELINSLSNGSALILPHRPYILLTGEFRDHSHELYLAGSSDEWHSERMLEQTKYIKFSDGSFPKPWIRAHPTTKAKHQPGCVWKNGAGMDCSNRDTWLELYSAFVRRRKQVCTLPPHEP